MVGPISSTSHYILLANSSFLEICDINFSVPSMLSSFLAKTETIFYMAVSYHSTSSSFYATEPFFLALMAFDRCVAICHPPYYPTIMTRKSVEPCVCLLDGWLFLLCHYSFPSFIFLVQMPLITISVIVQQCWAYHVSLSPRQLWLIASSVLWWPSSFCSPSCVLQSGPLSCGSVSQSFNRKQDFSTSVFYLVVVSFLYGSVMVMWAQRQAGSQLLNCESSLKPSGLQLQE